jgi:hypothetical protein
VPAENHDCLATGRLPATSDRLYQVPYERSPGIPCGGAVLDVTYANTSNSAACHINLKLKSADSGAVLWIGQDTPLAASGTMNLEDAKAGPGDMLFGDSDGAVDFTVAGKLENK